MWFVVADADQLGLRICPAEGASLARTGERIKVATREQCPVRSAAKL